MPGEPRAEHKPQVLLPFPGPDPDRLDVFVYLRPETNGVRVESAILSVIKRRPRFRSRVELVYLANVPGDFIVRQHIIERHYASRIFFAVHGGAAFSADMVQQFERFYGTAFVPENVVGAYPALRTLGLAPEELFSLWVGEDAITHVAGQVIKRYQGTFIVNCDIPALLHKNNAATDIAVMIFRTSEGYPFFFELAQEMRISLIERGLLRRGLPTARAVHISRSPFEQLIDSRDYLIGTDGKPAGIESSSFAQYLLQHGVDHAVVRGLAEHPLCSFDFGPDLPRDQSLLELCEGFSYSDGLHMLRNIVAQAVIPCDSAYPRRILTSAMSAAPVR